MFQIPISYFQLTFSNELTNALFIAIIFGLIVTDMRNYLPIEYLFRQFKIKSGYIKLLLFPFYYIFLITGGLIGLFLVIFVLWLISLIL